MTRKTYAPGSAGGQLTYLKELADYLKMVNEADYPDEAAKLDTLLPTVFEQLRQKLEEECVESEFILGDEDGEVFDVVVNNLEVFLCPLGRFEGEAAFDFTSEIANSADVVYDDPEGIIYDTEEDRRIALAPRSAAVEIELE